ncbi:MAG: dienelactone hydrolase family protein [Nocardioides sp.]
MAEILLFHHAGGLTPGVTAFADDLRAAGHQVHTPDVFDGHTFDDVTDGVAYIGSIGHPELYGRAEAAVGDLRLGASVVYAGMSMGCGLAANQLLTRPDARAGLFLYGAVTPQWWEATWPAGVPAQSHQSADDPWREAESDEAFINDVPGGDLFIYPGAGHLFLDRGHLDFNAEAAALATSRILDLLAGLDA